MRFALIVLLLAVVGCKKDKEAAPAPPAPPAAAATCASDADCVFSCDVEGNCCHNPYCEMVQLQTVAAANAAKNQEACTDAQRAACPTVGARAEPDYTIVAKCSAGACVAEKAPKASAAWRNPKETVDAAGFDRSCKTADDCRIVDELPCNHCNCGSVSIAIKELERFNQASTAIPCGPQPKLLCTDCAGFVATCEAGTCGKKPAR